MAPGARQRRRKPVATKGSAVVTQSAGEMRADWRDDFHKVRAGVDDLTLVSRVDNADILSNLEIRFMASEIYTYIGHVLLSVNPFQDLNLYSDSILASYLGKSRIEMPPHLFAIAEAASTDMRENLADQCIIVTGESGAGKTEATKKIMHYLLAVSGSSSPHINNIKSHVANSNTILEAFGNAKTIRNDNSSRFGKYLEIYFDENYEPTGATITSFLLEKGRVVTLAANERNFHILYQLCAGATKQMQQDFSLYGAENFSYTSQGGCCSIAKVDDGAEFRNVLASLSSFGVDSARQHDIIKLLSAILWLGNVDFADSGNNGSVVIADDVVQMVAYLLGIQSTSLQNCLMTRLMETSNGTGRNSVYCIPLNAVQARAQRDALAKLIYNSLFDWLISHMNDSMALSTCKNVRRIGLLDIYGFETMKLNSFEQLCINYVNEKLQQIFIELTLKGEQEEYVRENISWTSVSYFNNQIVCDLIEEKRPPGIFSIMNDVVATSHADVDAANRSLAQRLGSCNSHPHFSLRADSFCIRHYAGDVSYEIAGMAEKNKDYVSLDLREAVASSSFKFLRIVAFNDDAKKGLNRGKTMSKPQTAANRIKNSAQELVGTLMKTRPSYIRCIKPNDNKRAKEFDKKRVMHQVKYLGLLENVRVRRAGFCHRELFDNFLHRFYLLSRRTSYAGTMTWTGDSRAGCLMILTDSGIASDEWQLGRTKVFVRHPETLWALEHLRKRYWHNMAARIQRAYRAHVRRKLASAVCIQRAYRQWRSVRDFLRLRDYGHELLGQRKQRRRYSLISARRFRGDYLFAGESTFFQQTCNTSVDPLLFSAECAVLEDRRFRSPRFADAKIILTSANLFVFFHEQNGKPPPSPLKVEVHCLRKLSLSPLADDLLVLHRIAPEQADIVIACVFKTELCVHLQRIFSGTLEIHINSELKVQQKKKTTTIQFLQDCKLTRESVCQNGLKFTVGAGEPSNSTSNRVSKPNNLIPPKQQTYTPKHTAKQRPTHATSRGPPPAPPAKEIYSARFSYVAQRSDEISFRTGMSVVCLESDKQTGWFKAQLTNDSTGVIGWVPSNYFEPSSTQQSLPVAASQLPREGAKLISVSSLIDPPRHPKSHFDESTAGKKAAQAPPPIAAKKPAQAHNTRAMVPPATAPKLTPLSTPPLNGVQTSCDMRNTADSEEHRVSLKNRARAMGAVATPMAMTGNSLTVARSYLSPPPTPPLLSKPQQNSQPPAISLKKPKPRNQLPRTIEVCHPRGALMPPTIGAKPSPNAVPVNSARVPPMPDASPPPVPRPLPHTANARVRPFQ